MATVGSSSTPRIQVFRPTMEEFKNFSQYIEYVESQGAHKAGLAKIIPPEGWIPRKSGYNDIEMVIPSPISQMVTGSHGCYQQLNIQQKAMSVENFRVLAESDKYKTPTHFDYEDLERKYWKNITYNPPIYGADVSGSLYDPGVDEFNIKHLNTILDLIKNDYEIQIEGVNTAYLYFGMWKTSFAWHTEDMDLYSINYLHYGAPKSWYVVPPEHGRRLERLATSFFHQSYQGCSAFLRHKMTIISPNILKNNYIPFNKITQEPGEFIITFPFGYHSGFNHGYNIAESTNFALPRWVEYGKRSLPCTCRNDCVKISMDSFVRKFQPEKYELWLAGKDMGTHPEDPSRHYAAPPPRKLEMAINAQREEKKRCKDSLKIKRHPISSPDKSETEQAIENTEFESSEAYEVPSKKLKRHCASQKRKRKNSKNSVHSLIRLEPKLDEKTDTSDVAVKAESDANGKMEVASNTVLADVKAAEKIPTIMKRTMAPQIDYPGFMKSPNSGLKIIPVVSGDEYITPDDIPCITSDDVQVKLKIGSTLSQSPPQGVIKSPPKLKPFWQRSPDKPQAPVKVESKKSTVVTTPLNLHPLLRQAISSGHLALKGLPNSNKSSAINEYHCQQSKNPLKLRIVTQVPANKKVGNSSQAAPQIYIRNPASASNGSTSTFNPMHKNVANKNEVGPKCTVILVGENFNKPTGAIHRLNTSKISINHLLPTKNKLTTTQTNNNGRSAAMQSVPSTSMTKQKVTMIKLDNKGQTLSLIKKGPRIRTNPFTGWIYPVDKLWQRSSPDFAAEKEFNERLAAIKPHCAICILFTNIHSKADFPAKLTGDLPTASPVEMAASCYSSSFANQSVIKPDVHILSDNTAYLATCSACKVTVHAPCYGIEETTQPWTCTRCLERDSETIECCLCMLRGGALKQTTDKRWAHIVCGVLIPGVTFLDTQLKQPIDVSKVQISRQRLKCKYCLMNTNSMRRGSKACIQCSAGKCFFPFHVTCAYLAGVVFQVQNWPDPIRVTCIRHTSARRRNLQRVLTPVSVGDRVIAKHKSMPYYATIREKYGQPYYSVHFEDNSISKNVQPEDIVDRDCAHDGPPQINEKVRVKWNDGEVYNGILKDIEEIEKYVVEFDDLFQLNLKRKDFYSIDETLPKEIASKLSRFDNGGKSDPVPSVTAVKGESEVEEKQIDMS